MSSWSAGGLGVTAVVAALRTGRSGTVQCFEGSKEHVYFVRETAERNGVTNVAVHRPVLAKRLRSIQRGAMLGRFCLLLSCPPAMCSNWTAKVPRWKFSAS